MTIQIKSTVKYAGTMSEQYLRNLILKMSNVLPTNKRYIEQIVNIGQRLTDAYHLSHQNHFIYNCGQVP